MAREPGQESGGEDGLDRVDPVAARVEAAAREIELKLELDSKDLPALREHPLLRAVRSARRKPKELLSTYFDTPDQRLRKSGMTLRLRRAGTTTLQTVKSANATDAGLFSRAEWEGPVAGDAPDLAAAAQTALAPLLAEAGVRERLGPVFAVSSRRDTIPLAGEDWRAELTIDDGAVEGGGRREAICEVEIELREGRPRALFALARELAAHVPLRLGIRTKADRGYALLAGDGPKPVRSVDPGLSTAMSAGDAFQAIARACLRQLVANEAVLRHERDPLAVHQMRVALRRLRAAISVFRDIVHDKRVAAVSAELKWMAKALSDARDLDVFIDREIAPIRAKRPRSADAARLEAHFGRERDDAYDRAFAALASERYRLMLIDAVAWIEAGPWLTKGRGAKRNAPVRDVASKTLAKRAKAIRKKGRLISTMDVEERHELRIAVKKLRYAAEFFAPLYADGAKAQKRSAKLIKALEAMQERLGELNDAATSVSITGRLDRNDPGQRRAARLLERDDVGRAAAALASARDAYASFVKAKPFWE